MLERLDPAARTMLSQVGKPWLAAVLASGLTRLPKRPRVRLRLRGFGTSAERLAWAKANGCPWWDGAHAKSKPTMKALVSSSSSNFDMINCNQVLLSILISAPIPRGASDWTGSNDPCALAANGGHLEALQWAREHGTAVQVEPLESMLKAPGTERLKLTHVNLHSMFAFKFNLRSHSTAAHGTKGVRPRRSRRAPGGADVGAAARLPVERVDLLRAAEGGQLAVLKWARANGCKWNKGVGRCKSLKPVSRAPGFSACNRTTTKCFQDLLSIAKCVPTRRCVRLVPSRAG